MHRTIAELDASMSVAEFVQWQHYAAIEPFGEGAADMRTAHLLALLANVNRDIKQRPAPFEWPELVPWNQALQDEVEAAKEAQDRAEWEAIEKMSPKERAALLDQALFGRNL